MKNSKNEAVVLVHGLWMKGFEQIYMYIRLWWQGYHVYIFQYSSIFKTPEQNAKNLSEFIRRITEPEVHFIGHSLGGIVVAHLFDQEKQGKKGKVVMLASPLNGSAAAAYVAKNKYIKWLLGKSIINGLLGDAPEWKYLHKTCVIAGVSGYGIGRFLAGRVMKEKNDGTVNLKETELTLAEESHEVARSHFGILFSGTVVAKILHFLKQ